MYVVFIHGPAAAGKLTIGSLLSKRTGLPLFHNHLAVDLAKTLFDFGTPPFVKLREEIWLSSFALAAEANQSFIFTFTPEATVNPELIRKLEQIIEDGNGSIHFIELKCSDFEIMKRLGNESRAKFGKLLDVEKYKELKSNGGFDFPSLPKPLLTIDTERMNAEEASQRIQNALSEVTY